MTAFWAIFIGAFVGCTILNFILLHNDHDF